MKIESAYCYKKKNYVMLKGNVYLSNTNRLIATISSRILGRNYHAIKSTRIKPIQIKRKIILLKPDKQGTKLYLCKKWLVKFMLKPEFDINFKTNYTSSIKYLINPKIFGLSLEDFGVFSKNTLGQLFSKEPDIWIRGWIAKKPKGINLGFAADNKIKGFHVAISLKDGNKIILKRVKETKAQVCKGMLIRKISGRYQNGILISLSTAIKNKKFSKQPLVGIYYEDWKNILDIKKLFLYTEEGILAKELFDRKIKVLSTHSIDFDIGILDKKCSLISIIEITKSSHNSNSFAMFSTHGSRIVAKAQTLRIWSIKNNKPSFVVINKKWSKFRWIEDFKEICRKDKCYVLFTSFNKNWEKEIADKIQELLY